MAQIEINSNKSIGHCHADDCKEKKRLFIESAVVLYHYQFIDEMVKW